MEAELGDLSLSSALFLSLSLPFFFFFLLHFFFSSLLHLSLSRSVFPVSEAEDQITQGVSEALWRGGSGGGGMEGGGREGDQVSHLQRSPLSASLPSSSSSPGSLETEWLSRGGKHAIHPSPLLLLLLLHTSSLFAAAQQINKGSKWEPSTQRDDSSPPPPPSPPPPSLQRYFISCTVCFHSPGCVAKVKLLQGRLEFLETTKAKDQTWTLKSVKCVCRSKRAAAVVVATGL